MSEHLRKIKQGIFTHNMTHNSWVTSHQQFIFGNFLANISKKSKEIFSNYDSWSVLLESVLRQSFSFARVFFSSNHKRFYQHSFLSWHLFRCIQDSILMRVPKFPLQKSEMKKMKWSASLPWSFGLNSTRCSLERAVFGAFEMCYMIWAIWYRPYHMVWSYDMGHSVCKSYSIKHLPVEHGQDQLYYQQGWSGHLVTRLSLSLFVPEVQWYPLMILLWGNIWPLITVKVKFFHPRIGFEIQRGYDFEGYRMWGALQL